MRNNNNNNNNDCNGPSSFATAASPSWIWQHRTPTSQSPITLLSTVRAHPQHMDQHSLHDDTAHMMTALINDASHATSRHTSWTHDHIRAIPGRLPYDRTHAATVAFSENAAITSGHAGSREMMLGFTPGHAQRACHDQFHPPHVDTQMSSAMMIGIIDDVLSLVADDIVNIMVDDFEADGTEEAGSMPRPDTVTVAGHGTDMDGHRSNGPCPQ